MAVTSADIANAYVGRIVDDTRAQGAQRLPPIRRMARDAGVAHVHIGRAVQALVKQGVLSAAPSRGIMLVNAGPRTGGALYRPSLRWMRLYERVCSDCLNGVIGHEQPLPPVKDLCLSYGGAPVTMRKVLRQLEANGIVTASGGRLRVSRGSPAAGGNRIVLYARSIESGEMALYTPRIEQHLYALEQTCIARGVRLMVQPCGYDQKGVIRLGEGRTSGAALADDPRVLGRIVWQEGGLPPGLVRPLIAKLDVFAQPIALFSENLTPAVVPGESGIRHLRCFVCDSDIEAGRKVGYFLLSRGHRRICCFASCAERDWERDRIAGLRAAYAESGLDDAVTVCSALTGEQERDITQARHTSNQWIEQALSAVARRLGIRYRHSPLRDFVAAYTAVRFNWERDVASLEPNMRRTMADRTITAWVGTNDVMATHCLQFLHAEGVGVPESVSVVGFDDSYQAASYCMTSYGFNGAAAMVRMVDYILRPNTVLDRGAANGTVVVDGEVHERSTTAGVGR